MIKFTKNSNEVVIGQGTTLYAKWETKSYWDDTWHYFEVYYWDGDKLNSQSFSSEKDVEFTIDADIDEIKQEIFDRYFDRELKRAMSNEEDKANDVFVKGREVQVVRGRKYPIGTIGKVVGQTQPKKVSYYTTVINLVVALDDEKITIEKNGRMHENYKNVMYINPGNCVVINPVVDVAAANHTATTLAQREVDSIVRQHQSAKAKG